MGRKTTATAGKQNHAGSFYDRIADLYNLTFKVNGYGRSMEKYFLANPVPLSAGARILDAGCGTGLLTLALLKAIKIPVHIVSLDLSLSSLLKARNAVAEKSQATQGVLYAQANILRLPFRDDTFDFVVTSGALEYVPLEEGFAELARVLKHSGHLLYLPVRPSPASFVLEKLFRFKAHTPDALAEHTERHFDILKDHKFPPHHVIGWTKSAVLAQKR